jgi:ABC-type dipeptide/oligopeptide/nickel transport system permease subunit
LEALQTSQESEQLRRTLGLDLPLGERYLQWLGQLLRGDLGRSFSLGGMGPPVMEVILQALPATLLIVGLGRPSPSGPGNGWAERPDGAARAGSPERSPALLHPFLMGSVWAKGVCDPVVGNDLGVAMHPCQAGPGHLLGTDTFGRDVFSILLAAAQPTFAMVSAAALTSAAIGTLSATLCACFRGWVDGLFAHLADVALLAPAPLVMVVIGFIGFLRLSRAQLNWGTMIYDAFTYLGINNTVPWNVLLASASAISLFAAAFYLVAGGLHDIADPGQRR